MILIIALALIALTLGAARRMHVEAVARAAQQDAARDALGRQLSRTGR